MQKPSDPTSTDLTRGAEEELADGEEEPEGQLAIEARDASHPSPERGTHIGGVLVFFCFCFFPGLPET